MISFAFSNALAICIATFAAVVAASTTCNESFTSISAADFAASLHPGWNPGNTMDAPHETDWGNTPLVESTFANVRSLGFRGIRLPVTWTYHMMDKAPYTIDADWLERVSTVIDLITSNDMYVMVNAHHDASYSFDLAKPQANYTQYEEKFYALWHQIGTKLACKSSMVAFEPLNEPEGTTAAHAAELNKLNNIFLKAIHDAGGHNSKRVVVLGGLEDNSVNMIEWLEIPKNVTNPIALTFHYYSPWDFTSNAWGRTIWGSEADKKAVTSDFEAVYGNYTQFPIIVGEFGAEVRATEPAARWKWYDHVMRTAYQLNFTMMLWDTSMHFVVDSPHPWEDPTGLNILFYASRGENNALADSTEDPKANEQWSTAIVWHKVGTPITDQVLPYIWNENALEWMGMATDASQGEVERIWVPQDFDFDSQNVTLKSSLLSTIFQVNGTAGIKANFTIQTSVGAGLRPQAVQWDVPQLAFSNYALDNSTTEDLYIPIQWKGLKKLATVKAVLMNGTFLQDTWTAGLGPLQQGRLDYSSNFDWNDENVIIKSSMLQLVKAANMATTLTFEFWPRVLGNALNFTVNV